MIILNKYLLITYSFLLNGALFKTFLEGPSKARAKAEKTSWIKLSQIIWTTDRGDSPLVTELRKIKKIETMKNES